MELKISYAVEFDGKTISEGQSITIGGLTAEQFAIISVLPDDIIKAGQLISIAAHEAVVSSLLGLKSERELMDAKMKAVLDDALARGIISESEHTAQQVGD